jgi:uncharacterized phiE125 gp8 family phage protein
MVLKISVEPAEEPIEVADAKDHLRVTHTDDDEYIGNLIKAARIWCENFQNRAYVTQTWRLLLDEFPSEDYIELPRPPLQSVTSVKYTDKDGAVTTLATSEYFVDTDSEPGRIVLNYDKTWPTTTLRPANGVEVVYVVGYGVGASVPDNKREAILLSVADWYENREHSSPVNLKEIPMSAKAILWQDRIITIS